MTAIYSDLNRKTPFNKILREDADSVISAIENILQTKLNERLFNLDITADLENLLFEPLTFTTANRIYASILSSIGRHEPRVRILNNKSRVDVNSNEDGYDIYLVFTIKGFEGEFSVRSLLPVT